MSEHALANALDVSEFVLASGEHITVLDSWPKVLSTPRAPVPNPAREPEVKTAKPTAEKASVVTAAKALAIEQGAYFEGKSRRTDNPLEEIKASSAGSPRDKPSDVDSKPHDEASAPRAAATDATDNPGAVTA